MNTMIRKVIAFMLCFVLFVGCLPANAWATDGDAESAAASETTGAATALSQDAAIEDDIASQAEEASVIITMSDYQNSSLSSNGKKTVPQTIVNAMANADVLPELALIGGDYTDGSVGADGDDQSQSGLKTELNNLTGILTSAWPGLPYYAIQGNHDYSGFVNNGTLNATGSYEQDNYIVYLINEDDFPWWQGNYGSGSSTAEDKATVEATTNALGAYLDTLIANGDTRPVVIMSHVPLHWSERSTATAWYYDNIYANILFDAINEKAQELDILFLFGHNHSSTASGGNYDGEIGGALAYVAVGETMKVPNGTDGMSNYTTKTLNFTYMNAGYVGKYAGDTSKCSISALTIDSDSIDIDRYTYSGTVYEETITLKNVEDEKPGEDAVLAAITVTTNESVFDYMIGGTLDLSGVTVVATYSDTTTVKLSAEEYTISGYDMNTAGEQTVTVSYGGFTDTFNIKVWNDTFHDGAVTVKVENIGVSGINAAENTADAAVAEALASVVDQYVSYDIQVNGYTQGNKATVTLPVPAGFDTTKLIGVSIEEGRVKLIPSTYNAESNTFSFVTNHFSTKAVGVQSTGDWIELPGGTTTYYTKVNSMTSGTPYIITNTGNSYALNRSSNSAVSGAGVTVTDNGDGTYSIATVSDPMVWYLNDNGNLYTVVNDTTYYLNGTYYYRYTLSVSTSASTIWSVSNNQISSTNIRSGRTVYLTVGSSISLSTNTSSLNIYARTTSTAAGGYARLSGALSQSYDLNNYEVATVDGVLGNVSIQTSTDGNSVSKTVPLSADMVTWDKTFDGKTAGTYTGTVTYEGKVLGTITVNVTGELKIDESWKELPDNEATSGGFQQVTDLNDLKEGEKYIVVVWRYFGNNPNEEGYVFHDANNGSIKVSTSDGYATITSTNGTIDDGCYWYITNSGNGRVTMQNVGNSKYLGSNIVADSNSAVDLYIASAEYSGYQNFAIGYNDQAIRYSSSGGSFSFSSNSTSGGASSANACNITIYKVASASDATDGGYAKLTGDTNQTYTSTAGTTLADVLEKVQIATSADGITVDSDTIAVTSVMVTWDKRFDGATVGTYTGTVTYKSVKLGEITVKITPAPVSGIELLVTSGTVSRGAGASAKTGGKIKVTYEDGSTQTINVTLGMLNKDSSEVGTFSGLTVTYGGKSVTGFTLKVEAAGNDFPEYPDGGAVDLNKIIGDSSQFQNTGVAEVQLSTSGIPVSQGIDVVLVLDTSSSMQETVAGFSSNRLTILRPAVNSLINQLQAKQEDGSDPDLDIAIVAFNGFTGNGNASEAYGQQSNGNGEGNNYIGATAYATPNEGGWLTDKSGDGWVDIMNLSKTWATDSNGSNITTGSGTNYDEGLLMAYELLAAKQEAWNEGEVRKQYVVFMSDGAPFQYNGVYSNYTQSEWNNWLLGNYAANGSDIPNTVTNKNYYNGGNGNGQPHRIAEAIKGDPMDTFQIVTTTADTNGTSGLQTVNGLGATVYSIGYLLADNGQVTDETQNIVLQSIASTADLYFDVDTAAQLDNAFSQIASTVKMAASNAYFVDQMGDNFNLQMASTITKFKGTEDETTIILDPAPKITVSTYDIYGKSDVNGTTVTLDMVGQRYGSANVLETVTFNAAGTEAYSTVNNVKSGNIIRDGVICAVNFFYNTTTETKTITLADGTTYDLPGETFRWNIGTINEKEFVLSYYVYLDGAAEGTKGAGTYATNNYANLYYTNWLDNDVSQSVQSPGVAWESAAVYYGFYLVDKNGKPVVNQTTGENGSFAEAVKVTSKVFYDEVLLNDIESVGTTIQVVSTLVPDGYTIYDNAATYTITIDSDAKISGWKIVNGKTPDTTYVTEYRGTEATNARDSASLDQIGMDYTATTVWFAVIWEPQCIDDTVVIDYGLPVDISVLANDMFGTYGTLIGVGPVNKMPSGQYTTADSADFGSNLTSTYGKATLNGAAVRYTPANMQMDDYDRFAYEVKYSVNGAADDLQYYYGTVTVIPATTIYYEDNFVSYRSDELVNDKWTENEDLALWKFVSNAAGTQDEDRPGEYSLPSIDANNLYGYDSAYKAMSTFSLGGYAQATVNYSQSAVAYFDFYGTGFDVVSLTNHTTGTILVTVYNFESDGDYSGSTPVKNFVVDTYYGYKQQTNAETGEIEWVVDPESSDSLYQVPVMKISSLDHDKYHAEIRVIYNAIFDHGQGDEEYVFYLDAIRIYDPANDGASDDVTDTTIKDAYKADGEGWPAYVELRNNVLAANSFDNVANDKLDEQIAGAVFIDGDEAVGDAHIADYRNYGPNNELYLASGQDLAFMLAKNNKVESVQLGVKSANGAPVTLTIMNISAAGTRYGSKTITVDTATDMYYDITSFAETGDVILISNTGGGILSLTNIKTTFTAEPSSNDAAPALYMTRSAAALTLRTLNTVETEPSEPETEPSEPETEPTEPKTEPSEPETEPTEPETKPTEPETEPTEPETEPTEPETEPTEPDVPEEPETFEPDKLNVYLSSSSVKVGNSVVVTVTTSQDVQYLTINGQTVTRCVYSRWTGMKTWVVTVEAETVGEMAIELVAYSAQGLASEPVTNTVTVSKKTGSLLEKLFGWIFG